MMMELMITGVLISQIMSKQVWLSSISGAMKWEFNGGNNMSWDGKTTDGLDIPSGTYYYTIELTDALGQTTNQTGPITIIR